MAYKPRMIPGELVILELLNKRMNLSVKEKQYYFRMKKGYEGELAFDSLTEKLQCECLILNELLLEVNRTTFQIDTLILMQGKAFLFEVKNLAGDYYYESASNKFYQRRKNEIVNPLHQLGRCESLFCQLLHNEGFSLPIDASIVFINPSFTLYQAPLDQPLIFPTQVKNYLSRMNTAPSKITKKHKQLADKLISLHQVKSPYKQIPNYKYNQLRKGITCKNCGSFSVKIEHTQCICQKCNTTERASAAILRNIKEFEVLFPDEKMTTNIIYDWCKVVPSKKRISRVLSTHYNIVGVRQWAYYE